MKSLSVRMPKRFKLLTNCLFCAAMLAAGCNNGPTGTVVRDSDKAADDRYAPYVEGNKNIMRRENEEMLMFINRYGWRMERSGTGLYYEITAPGKGETFVEGDLVTLEYSTFLLSGEKVYDSDSSGVKSFIVNRSEEIDALHEIAHKLRPGASAVMVIPSHLAYGVAGDGDRIAGLQPIVMKVHVTDSPEKIANGSLIKPNY